MKQSRLHIPILFAYDTIHGYRTIFPVPLGAASSFDPKVAAKDASIGARESATVGIKQIYSPMVDVSHEPRWGRIVEGNGEDPYLGSAMAAARVKGAQGNDYSARNKTVTSVKHFVAYGAPEGGRDYNTTDMSESPAAEPLPAPVQGGDRRRLGHGDVLLQLAERRARLCQQGHRDRHPEEGVGLRRVHRERLHGGRRDCARARPRTLTRGRAATAPQPTVRTPVPTR